MKQLRTTLEVLSQQEIELIHEKTIEILETIGMKVPDDETINLAQEQTKIIISCSFLDPHLIN